MNQTHIMVDTEFTSQSVDSAIVSIGATVFDPVTGGLGEKFYTRIDLHSSMGHGHTMDADTVIWWMSQTDVVRHEFMAGTSAPTLPTALDDFKDFIRMSAMRNHSYRESTYLWCHTLVDAARLAYNYEVTLGAKQLPWKRRNVIDLWTLKTLVELKSNRGYSYPSRVGDADYIHHALEDAKHQVLWASELYNLLGGKTCP